VAASGNYDAYVVVGGCTSATSNIAVVINGIPAAPVAGSNSPICDGSDINLTSNLIANATYNWSGPNGFVSNLQNPTIINANISQSGNYDLTVTVNGCTSPVSTINVVVNPIPTEPVLGSNSPNCDGGNILLTAAGIPGATYSWIGPLGFNSNLQNPIINNAGLNASGNYNCFVVVNGCTSNVSTLNIVVNPNPAEPIIGNNSPVCVGDDVDVTSNFMPGVNYFWSGPANFSSTNQNFTLMGVTSVESGNYFCYVVENGCSSTVASTNVVVNNIPNPPVINSNSPVCEGSSINLTANPIAGVTYVWSGPGGFSSNLQNPTINPSTMASGGNYGAYVVFNGCTSNTVTTNVVINPIPATPVIGSNSPLCEGQTLNLSSNLVAGANYSWTGPNGYTSNQQNPSIANTTTNESGAYNLTVTVNNCASQPASVNVVINPIPAAPVVGSNSPICSGSSLNLTANQTAGATYVWSGPGAFVSNQQNPVINPANNTQSGNYTAYIVVNGCTSATSNTNVLVNPLPTSAFNATAIVCGNDNATINYTGTGGAGATYNWNFDGGNIVSGVNQGPYQINWNNSGTYNITLTVTENNCPSTQTSQTVTVNTVPTSAFLMAPNGCEGENITVTYTGNASPNATYNWALPGGTLVNGNAQGPLTLTWNAANTYPVSLTVTENGCVSTITTQNITINPTPTALAGVDLNICSGDPATIGSNALPGYTYQWLPIAGLNDPTISNPSITATNLTQNPITTHYVVTVTANGCSSTDDVNVTIRPIPVAILNLPPPQCLLGNSFNFAAAGTYSAAATFDWTFANSNTPISNNANPAGVQFISAGSQTVTFTVTDNGCPSVPQTGQVIVYDIPLAAFSAQPATGCEPLEVFFTNNSQPQGLNCTYTFGDGASSNAANPSHVYMSGIYSVTLTVTDGNGCTNSVTQNNLVQVTPNPVAGFTANPMVTTLDNGLINFIDGSSFANSWSYDFGDGNTSNLQNPSNTYTAEGTYTIIQTVSNQFGCTDTASVTIIVEPVSIVYVPNGFTPNNDGLNDGWRPIISYVKDYTLRIYDRWGLVIFMTDDVYEEWNGKYGNDGVDVKEDVYVYLITYTNYQNKEKELRGHVTVVR
jgi:gliding motility-associated-like protein